MQPDERKVAAAALRGVPFKRPSNFILRDIILSVNFMAQHKKLH